MTLAECEELAAELGEPDGWSVAARFAAEILPGIFRLDDPCVRLRLAPESRLALEAIVEALPQEVFTSDDALGWVYQFWQSEKKDEVNASERKIGGADLGPVTQLFTENYMVRFLLENSLGAWWAARHPDSPLVKEWEYLRFDDDGKPAAGSFDGWPERVAEVTVMDPCCGSGHFLVEAFAMLWRMRVEEEGLAPVAAQDAVLRDNLFGLELDPRCVQIAMFAVALAAWKAGGGWRELPVPNIACSGIPVKAPVEEWKALADGDERLEQALERCTSSSGTPTPSAASSIPRRAVETSAGEQVSFDDVDWDEIAPLLEQALAREADDPATAVLGADAAGSPEPPTTSRAHYTLVATNVPYLDAGRAGRCSARRLATQYPQSQRADLATAFLSARSRCTRRGCGRRSRHRRRTGFTRAPIERFRESSARRVDVASLRRLGAGCVSSDLRRGRQRGAAWSASASDRRESASSMSTSADSSSQRQKALRFGQRRSSLESRRLHQLANPDASIRLARAWTRRARSRDVRRQLLQGSSTGDYARFVRYFWEVH